MTVWLAADNAVSRVAAVGVEAGDTDIPVVSGSGVLFPNPATGQAFPVRVGSDANHENAVCVGRDGDVLTLAAPLSLSWPADATVMLPFSAAVFADIVQRVELGTIASHDVDEFITVTDLASTISVLYGTLEWSPGLIGPGKSVSQSLVLSGVSGYDLVTFSAINTNLGGAVLSASASSDSVVFTLSNPSSSVILIPSGAEFYCGVIRNSLYTAYEQPTVSKFLDSAHMGSGIVLSGTGLSLNSIATYVYNTWKSVKGNTYRSSGIHEYSAVVLSGTNYLIVGLGDSASSVDSPVGFSNASAGYSTGLGTGTVFQSGFSSFLQSGSPFNCVVGDVITLIWDADAGIVSFYKNHALQSLSFSGVTGTLCPMLSQYGTTSSQVFMERW